MIPISSYNNKENFHFIYGTGARRPKRTKIIKNLKNLEVLASCGK